MSSLKPSIFVITLSLATLVTLALSGCTPPTPAATLGPSASHQELAYHYAPVIRQGVASDQDFITAVDFDGDWVGNNNWENQPTGDLSAYVYYSVVETETHWFPATRTTWNRSRWSSPKMARRLGTCRP
jgi:ABC-type oligopeptide transport system substrate-binding subunit